MNARHRFGIRLRGLRKQRGLTQQQLATAMEMSEDAVSALERGKSLPGFETIEKLAKSLDVQLKDLFEFDGTPIPKRKAQMIEEISATARGLPDTDVELALAQIKLLAQRQARK